MGNMNTYRGIQIPFGFKLWADSPIDVRFSVKTIAERDDLHIKGAVYYGLLVYVEEDDKTYKYCKDGSWKNMDDSAAEELNDKLSISGKNSTKNGASIRFGTGDNAGYIVGDGTTGSIGIYSSTGTTVIKYNPNLGTTEEEETQTTYYHGISLNYIDDDKGSITLDSTGKIKLIGATGMEMETTLAYMKAETISVRGPSGLSSGSDPDVVKHLNINIDNKLIYGTNEEGVSYLDTTKISLKGGYISGYLDGLAAEAKKLETVRRITIGTVSKEFDGSADVVFTNDEVGSVRTGGLNKTFDDTALLEAIRQDQKRNRFMSICIN